MKHVFYDVKEKQKVEREISEAIVYGDANRPRYAFRAKTADGRNLTAFVSKETFEKFKK